MTNSPDQCPNCGSESIVHRDQIQEREFDIDKPHWLIPDQSGGWRWYQAEKDQIHFADVGWIDAWDGASETKSRALDVMDTLGYVVSCPNCSTFWEDYDE